MIVSPILGFHGGSWGRNFCVPSCINEIVSRDRRQPMLISIRAMVTQQTRYIRSNRASRTWPQIPEIKIVPGTWDDDSNTVRSSNEHGTWDNYSSFEIVMIFLFLMIWYQVSLGPTRFSRRCSSSFENSRIFSSNSGRTKVHFTSGLVRFLESERYQKFQSNVKNIILRPSYILLLINICIYI